VIIKSSPFVSRSVVVDDCSRDRTMDVAELYGAEIIRFQQPSGKGAASIEGLKRAYQLGCSIAILIDGDGRYKTREIPWLISPIQSGNADVVIGSRYLESNGITPVRQLITQNSISPANNQETAPKITDPLSGFIALNRKALDDLNFSFGPYDFKQKFTEHLLNRRLRIHEVAITEGRGIPKKVGWDDSVKVVAALPALNEEKYVAKVIAGAQAYADAVMVVDDGSTDATAAIARQMGAYVISHEKNLGYGAALQTILATAKNLNLEAVVVLDADGQHDPNEVEKVLEPLLNGADIVVGSRFIDTTRNNIPSYRKVGMKVLGTATAAAGVKKVTDTQSGFRAYGKKAISTITISGTDMSAGSEILVRAQEQGLKIEEVPIHVRYDNEKTSPQNPVKHGVMVLYNIIQMISYRRPLPTFGIPGLIIFIIGFSASSSAFAEYYLTSKFPFNLSMIGGIFVIVGILLMITGLILNAIVVLLPKK
jgi:glycosyltransferase involved in cell wall biosynthesis